MSTSLSPEQQAFFEELQSFKIPDEIAVIVALKTNWQEIIEWDESKELWRLATIIWQTGMLDTTPSAARMAKKIRNKGLDTIYDPKQKAKEVDVGSIIPDFTIHELAEMDTADLDQLWLMIREELERRDPETLTEDEKNYFIMAIFYTTKAEE